MKLRRIATPESAKDFQRLIAITATEVRSGAVTPKIAITLASLAGAFLRCVETGDFELRLQHLERIAAIARSERRR
jgi:hypothetical protein